MEERKEQRRTHQDLQSCETKSLCYGSVNAAGELARLTMADGSIAESKGTVALPVHLQASTTGLLLSSKWF